MKNGLYENFEEIIEHSPDSIYDAVRNMEEVYNRNERNEYNREILGTYSACISYMELGKLYDKSYMLISDSIRSKDIDASLIRDLPQHYDRKNEALCLSSALHLIHQRYPSVHSESVYVVSNIKKDLLERSGLPAFNATNSHIEFSLPEIITGEDPFPPYLSILIDEKLKTFRNDLYLHKGVTWKYSHYDCGSDYDYSMSENAYVEVYAYNEQSLEMAKEILNSITYEEIDACYRECMHNEAEKQKHELQKSADEVAANCTPVPPAYFSNEYAAFYEVDSMPEDFTPYALNQSKDGFLPLFSVSDGSSNILFVRTEKLSDAYDTDEIDTMFNYAGRLLKTMPSGLGYMKAEYETPDDMGYDLDTYLDIIMDYEHDHMYGCDEETKYEFLDNADYDMEL